MITRRTLLKLFSLAPAAGLLPPVLQGPRAPYVLQGDLADYIGYHPGGFIGAMPVREVLPWDGVGYPVRLLDHGFPSSIVTYYDVDLADLRKEVPKRFWHDPANSHFPNVHTWLRMQRYGESLDQAVKHLNFRTAGRELCA
ncbi:hypothetical protein [Pseudomonas indica]|uniref:hypothetical protein n=1 Tax=Pseudomonas indica TaxID=137658 RepID=UPI003FD3CC73